MPDGWREEVDAALSEMRRVARPNAPIVIIETLGDWTTKTPAQNPDLEEYFDHLEDAHGMERWWCRTDYEFPDVSTAAEVLGAFFGPDMANRVRRTGQPRVPECTAVFHARR